ncbi:MAG: alpha-amylase family glycosyl hydrolase, partial [Ectothiorhodospiraceae bacterium]
LGDNEVTYATGNHDISRVVSSWGHEARRQGREDDFACLAVALVTSLPGSCCLYQGEELGLEDAQVPYEALKDPYGIEFFPEFPGRDCCRTPIPWTADAANAGFSAAAPWLPVDPTHITKAVDAQERDPASTLNRVRAFLNWRRSEPVMRGGADFRLLDTADGVVAGVRSLGGEKMLCAFNMGSRTSSIELPAGNWESVPVGGFHALRSGSLLTLPAFGGAFLHLR